MEVLCVGVVAITFIAWVASLSEDDLEILTVKACYVFFSAFVASTLLLISMINAPYRESTSETVISNSYGNITYEKIQEITTTTKTKGWWSMDYDTTVTVKEYKK